MTYARVSALAACVLFASVLVAKPLPAPLVRFVARAASTLSTSESHRTVASRSSDDARRGGFVEGVELDAPNVPDGAEARVLASGDLDGDGAPELFVAYTVGARGALAVYRGNVDAVAPSTVAAKDRRERGESVDSPFLPNPTVIDLADAPVGVGAGDFDADGKQDVVVAAGDALYLFSGDGAGAFAAPSRFALPGTATALATGELDRPDGLTDLVVGVDGPAGAAALLYHTPSFSVGVESARVALSAPASAIAIGAIGSEAWGSVSIAAGRDLTVVSGRGGAIATYADVVERTSTRRLDFSVRSLALGLPLPVVGSRLSLLSDDGARYDLRDTSGALETVASKVAGASAVARVGEGVVLLDAEHSRVHIVADEGDDASKRSTDLDVESAPVAALALQLSPDATEDLVVVRSGSVAPFVSVSKVAATRTVTNMNDSGAGSLRQAMIDSASDGGAGSLINFNIGGNGVHTITLASALPQIDTANVTIDGTSQPGFSTSPLIEINGNSLAGNGIAINASSTAVFGLTINRCTNAGIRILSGTSSVVRNCFVGVNSIGNTASPNGYGIWITGSTVNTVGGSPAAFPSVFSGNANEGVLLQSGASNNSVRNCYVGLGFTGLAAVGNGVNGIGVQTSLNQITGCSVGASGNTGVALEVSGTTGNVITSSNIGVAANGVVARGNLNSGVDFFSDSGSNQLGQVGAGNIVGNNTNNGVFVNTPNNSVVANTFLFNGKAGVFVNSNTGNVIDKNAMHDNVGLGIDLAPVGVTANDPGDGDTGPNGLQNYPVLTSASTTLSATTVTGTLNSTPNTSFSISFYSNFNCDSSGFGEGEAYLGATTVTTNGTGNVGFTATVPMNSISQTVTATARKMSTGDTSESSACVTSVLEADMEVTISDAPDPVASGTSLTYQVQVTNLGPGVASNATWQMNTPPNTTFVSVFASGNPGWTLNSPSVGGTGTISGTNPSFASTSSTTFTVTLSVDAATPAGTIITGTATTGSATPDSNTANNSASTTTTVSGSADLSVTIGDAPDPVNAGANLTFTIMASNAGPSNAQSVSVTMNTPANTTFVSATPAAGWGVTAPSVGGTGVVAFTRATFATGPPATFTVVVKVDANTVSGSTISAGVGINTATNDPDSSNNVASTGATVTTSADLGVTIADAPDPVSAGANITYSIDVTNAGPSDAQSTVVTFPIPANTTLVNVIPASGWGATAKTARGGVPVVFSNPSFAAGDAATLVVVVQVVPSTADGSTISASVTISSATTDPTPGNNAAATTTTVGTAADLSVAISDAPDPAAAGTSITYSITAQNAGPSDAQTVAVTFAVPANTVFVSSSAPAGWSTSAPPIGGTGTVTFTRPMLASGASGSFTVVVGVGAAVADGTTIPASVSISSATADSSSGNNTANTTTTVATAADLSISISAAPAAATAGSDLTYSITVSNAGPSDALGVTATEATPANTTFVSASAPAGWTCTTPAVGATGTISCSVPALAAGASATITVVVRVDPSAAIGSNVSAAASVSSATTDSTSSNNTASTSTPVGNTADLSVSITSTPAAPKPSDDITYTITVSNAGPSDAPNVALVDVVPQNTGFVSVSAPAGWTCETPAPLGTGAITCMTPSLPAGTAASFTVVVRVNFGVPAGTVVTSTATVTTDATDPNGTNDSAAAATTVAAPPAANLAIENTVTPASVAPGSTITFTLAATNAGPNSATGVTISDPLPTGVTFVSATASGNGTCTTPAQGAPGTVTCTWAGPTAVGETRTTTIVAQVSAGASNGTAIVNIATVSSATPELDSSDNSATSTATVVVAAGTLVADVGISVSPVPDAVDTGDTIEYTATVHNNGPDTATGVHLAGSTPVGTRLASISSSQGTCTGPSPGGTGPFQCELGDLASGESATVTLTVTVVAPGGTSFGTIFAISSTSNDSNPFNNSSASNLTSVNAGLDTMLAWDPPLPCDSNCLNPPLHLQTTTVPSGGLVVPAGVRDTRNTVIGYNIYRSNQPNVQATPENFFSTVPATVTTIVAPTAPGGSFFTVTATYPNGESDDTNAASGGLPEPTISAFVAKGNKSVITGEHFDDVVQVFVDGIPFKKPAKVKNGGTTIQQKGKLITGQSVQQYIQQQGGVILVSVLNGDDTGIGTYLYRKP